MPRLAYVYTSKKVATQNYSDNFSSKTTTRSKLRDSVQVSPREALGNIFGRVHSCKRLKIQFRYEKRSLADINLLKELIRETGKTIEV